MCLEKNQSSKTEQIRKECIVMQSHEYDLESTLKNITPENLHHLLLNDEPIGKEEW
jgi:antitoxin component of MazEF toxin-antitoxin module